MRGLRWAGHILHVGAHPDDEDAGLMALMSRKFGARTVYWSATRGEAGQNRIGSQVGEALGIYRTWESLAARAIDGGESLYGPFYDFGFCSSVAEAITRWGWHALVREIVRAIRLVQPQVLIARFTGDLSDGHGQHRAIGAATRAAFDAAADPKLFPELGLAAWKTPKLYQSTGGDWQPGEANALGERRPDLEADGFIRIDTGEHDPIAGVSYQQVAWAAFNCHQTQAMGFFPHPGSFYYYYRLEKSRVATKPLETSFYDGLDPTLAGLARFPGRGPAGLRSALAAVCKTVDAALGCLSPHDPSRAADPLLEGLGQLRQIRADIDDRHPLARQLDDKVTAFQDTIVGCLGLHAECIAARAHVAAGERVRIRGGLWNSRGVAIDASTLTLRVPDGWDVVPAADVVAPHQIDVEITIPAHMPPTTPSWLQDAHDGASYSVPVGAFACEALDAPLAVLDCELVVRGHRLTLQRPVLRRESFAGGHRALPLTVLPEVSVRPQTRRMFLPGGGPGQELELLAAVHRQVDHPSRATRLRLAVPEGWTLSPPCVDLPSGVQDEVTSTRFVLTVPGDVPQGAYRLAYLLGSDPEEPAVTLDPVRMGPPGLPRLPDAATCIREAFMAVPSEVQVHVLHATFHQGLKYGYLRGAAEGILEALPHFGLEISVISDQGLNYRDLSDYHAIIVGPNAYLIREEVRRNSARLLDYVAKGGTLIVQYQAYGYEQRDFAPYPFDYSHPHDRVTYPDAPVTVIDPRHPLMSYPNQITEEDFAGWVHDRGLYFFGTFDDRYTPILACSEPGQDVKLGGLVAAGYGQGTFVYVGYSLFRQIPAGVPGAFRLLANLLALPEALLLQRVERLKALTLFAFLADDQLMAIARLVSENHEPAGVYLCRQGDVGKELFILVKGEVEILRHTDAGCVVLKAHEGQVVGEFAILAEIPRTADLRTATPVHYLSVSSANFRVILQKYPEIAEGIIRQLVLKLVAQ